MWRRLGGFAVLLTVAVAVVSAPASPACACSCVPPTPTPSFADLVFDGVVLDVAGRTRTGGGAVRVRFAVETLAKGTAGSEVVISTSAGSASCGYEFLVGRRYHVNAHNGTTGLCSSNRLLPPAASPPAASPPAAVPSPVGPPGGQSAFPGVGPTDPGPSGATGVDLARRVSPSTPWAGWLPWLLVGGGLLGAAGLVRYLLRRRVPRPSA